MKDMILYHGSRKGLNGEISPISRSDCDFGKGFYMGESEAQAQMWISNFSDSTVYKMNFRLSEIPEDRILVLKDKEWLCAVLANRELCEPFNTLKLAKEWKRKLDHYDVIIGDIADDRMTAAISEFVDGNLTDKGLIACLNAVQYGKQIVPKTEFACSKIDIIKEHTLTDRDIINLSGYFNIRKKENSNIIEKTKLTHRYQGMYINDFLDKERKKERKGIER